VAATLGVALDDITRTIEVYSGPLPVNAINRFGRTWRVEVQAPPGRGEWAKELGKLRVRGAEGQMVPLAALVKVRQVEAPAVLDFLDLQPMVELTANLAPGASLETGPEALHAAGGWGSQEAGAAGRVSVDLAAGNPQGK